MPYATGRIYHDADSHLMEPQSWLRDHAPAAWRDRMPRLGVSGGIGEASEVDWVAKTCPLHLDPDYRADESQVTLRKNFYALGSFERDHRAQALDQLGFASQLVFNTFTSTPLVNAEHGDDVDFAYAMADAHNRGIVHFCSVDERLLPVGDMDAAVALTREAIDGGTAAIQIGQNCTPDHSPSHIALEPMWAMCAEAGVPVLLHVAGAGANVMHPAYFENGGPPVPDFHGGDTNFKSIDYMSIPLPVMQTLNAIVIDGILQRHPNLRVGVIELGASWVPGWMRMLDSAFEAFRKNEDRLQQMEMKPSEYVQRQVRATPYPHEDTGWTIANSGEQVCLFSSDFPHVEGGRNPIGRFERSLDAAGIGAPERDAFYFDNFVDLMRPVLEARGLATVAA
jgi:predicted TIM-barrel fold metal-dependent hydrolase